ncbi:hypothetical protein [Tenacibaculum finnmarkense]|uniref:hypothetical protein n=1 Tax=Tenacibaculum finnmarkense TaxID=2781243 RepID=UPI00187B202B|nr:hypothetical protein [Tenacibaculum finnmarkense]MBE7649154.1 hypothetical protein [Tenacibaculum finnmarkense genomovar ulcerans]
MENLRLIQISNSVELLERAIRIAENMIADFCRKWQEGIISKFDYLVNFKRWEQKRIDFCLKLNDKNNFNLNKKE